MGDSTKSVWAGALVAVALACGGCTPVQNGVAPSGKAGTLPDSTLDRVRKIVSEQMNVPLENVKPTTTLGELGADDLDYVELIMEFEDTFSIKIPDEKTPSLTGNQDVLKTVTIKKLSELVDEIRGAKPGK